ncbi:MAG: hypothetical protein AB8W37_04035 [Arsenophonus endosymbiont of Dermacentor nuttalli]
MNIKTALYLSQMPTNDAQKFASVVFRKDNPGIKRCFVLDIRRTTKNQKANNLFRSFGRKITEFEFVRQSICAHAERAADKLRQGRQTCRSVSVAIQSSRFSHSTPGVYRYASKILYYTTQDSRDIIKRQWRFCRRYVARGN